MSPPYASDCMCIEISSTMDAVRVDEWTLSFHRDRITNNFPHYLCQSYFPDYCITFESRLSFVVQEIDSIWIVLGCRPGVLNLYSLIYPLANFKNTNLPPNFFIFLLIQTSQEAKKVLDHANNANFFIDE